MQDFKMLILKLKRPILFFAILGVITILLSVVVEKIAESNDELLGDRNKSIIRIQNVPKNSIDAIITGDSESYTSFSPVRMWEETGISSYVCGQSGQRIQETYYMLETMFKTQSPKVVVIETNTLFRAKTGISGLKESIAATGKQFFPILIYHDIWKTVLAGKTYPERQHRGFIPSYEVKAYRGGHYMKETNKKVEVPEFVDSYFERIMKLCNDHDAKVCLISVPSPKNYNYKKHNGLQTFANEYGVDYLDLNLHVEELGIDWKKDSRDKGDHLNNSGAEKVSDYVGQYLKAKYDLREYSKDEFWL